MARGLVHYELRFSSFVVSLNQVEYPSAGYFIVFQERRFCYEVTNAGNQEEIAAFVFSGRLMMGEKHEKSNRKVRNENRNVRK